MTNLFDKIILNNFNNNKIPKNKKILITGSSGFIGINLINALLLHDINNNKIYGIDVVKSKLTHKNFTFIKKNLLKITKKDLPKTKFDYIIHLAGIPSPVYYKKNPLGTIFLNLDLSKLLMDKSLNDNSKFIYFSSSEIYGNPSKNFIPTKENYPGYVSSVSDRSCYDESKRMGETLTYIYKNYYNLNAKIIRPFNFYGEGMKKKDRRIIPQFFSQAVNNKTIRVFSHGKQTRTYCHIIDAVVMILSVIFHGKHFIYNIGNNQNEISAYEIAKKIKNIMKKNNIIIKKVKYPANYPSDEPKRRCPSIKKFTNEFKYKPKISLEKGLLQFKLYAEKNFK